MGISKGKTQGKEGKSFVGDFQSVNVKLFGNFTIIKKVPVV